MNLLETRQDFIRSSGRYDLVLSEYRDNGADKYLNAGQRLLDNLILNPKTEAWDIPTSGISDGDYILELEYLKSVKEIWIVDSESRTKLKEVTLNWMRDTYTDLITDQDKGRPAYWCPIPLGLSPSLHNKSSSDYSALLDVGHIKYGNHFGYTGIMFTPVSDSDYTVQILGNFYSRPFTGTWYTSTREDSTAYVINSRIKWSTGNSVWKCTTAGTTDVAAPDISSKVVGDTITDGTAVWTMLSFENENADYTYWSVNFPELLVEAATARVDIEYGNLTGFKNRIASLRLSLQGIDNSMAESEMGESPQMITSWRSL